MATVLVMGRRARHAGRASRLVAALLFAILPCIVLTHALAQAATPASILDATQQRRAQEREAQMRAQRERSPDARIAAPAAMPIARLPETGPPCVQISEVQMGGEDAARFAWALDAIAGPDGDDSPLGKCLGSAGIDLVLQRVQAALQSRGFVTTRVLLGQQATPEGTLVLTVLPGRIRSVRFAVADDGRATLWNTVPARPGDILNIHDVEQALDNFRRASTVQADIAIEPAEGAGPGLSDLVISHNQAVPFRASVSVDDGGTRATGKYQGAVTFSYDNWWTLSDLFYLSVNHDLGGGDAGHRGTRGGTAHYSVPAGAWTLSGTLSQNRYSQTVAGASQDYLYAGTSRNAELKASRVVWRDDSRKTTAFVKAFRRQSSSFIDDTEILVQHRVVGGWEVGAGHREFLGNTTLDANVAYRRGTGAFGSIPAPEEPFNEGTSRFALITADANLSTPFDIAGHHLRYNATWRAQTQRTPLTPQDRFAIGGRHTVRGFDGEASLSAERGWLLRNELGVTLGDAGQELYMGFDHGHVGGPSAVLLAGTQLTGAVIGLRGAVRSFQFDIFAGAPLRKPAGFRTSSGTMGFQLAYSL